MRPHRRYLISLFSVLARLVSPSPSSVRYIMQPPLHVSSPFFSPRPLSLSPRLTDRRYRFFFFNLPLFCLLLLLLPPLHFSLYTSINASRLSSLPSTVSLSRPSPTYQHLMNHRGQMFWCTPMSEKRPVCPRGDHTRGRDDPTQQAGLRGVAGAQVKTANGSWNSEVFSACTV